MCEYALSSLFLGCGIYEYSAADPMIEHRQKYQTGFVKKIWNTFP
jgi:hypothetical protein